MTEANGIMLGVFLGLVALGIGMAIAARRTRSDVHAHDALALGLARGEISPDDYRRRSTLLGPRPRRVMTPIAITLIAAGFIGALMAGAMADPGFMHGMMKGGMGSMMGGGGTERSGSSPVSGAREILVSAHEFSFEPAQINVRIDETVNIALVNRGNMFHTLTIAGLGVQLRANGGDQIAAALRGERTGSYAFVCTVSGHADAGMRGTLVVSEAS